MGSCLGKGRDTVRPVYTTTTTGTSFDTGTTNTTGSHQYSFESMASTQIDNGDLSLNGGAGGGRNLHTFSYAELRSATKNFGQAGRLGEGGFGTVYKGYIDEQTFSPTKPGQGITVAVKKLNLEGQQGHREWVTEVHFLGALHHPNLVKLIGFCAEDCNRLLVYEYMSRGSLENHLFNRGRNGNRGLSWAIRMKIALGAARGVAFLHEAERSVIYRDFKAANILLDDDYNAKLSDFGLAKEGPTGDNTHVSTRVMGTYGYAAPEYLATGHLSARSDVYSFGVVLLEFLTGRQAMDPNRPVREQKLVEWTKPYLNDKKKVTRVVDPNLQGQYSLREAQKIAGLALWCLSEDSKARPTMKKVVEHLEQLNKSNTAPKP